MACPSDDDVSLVSLARLGDIAAFGRLCERHRASLLRIAWLEAGRADEVHDIVQDSFAAALTAIGALREPEAVGRWLAGIVRNQARMRRRAASLHPEVALDEAFPSEVSSLWERRSLIELAHGLEQAITGLPGRRADAMRMHYWDGRGVSEIATCMQVAPGTVKRWLHESRCTMRQEMIRMGTAPEGIVRSRKAALFCRSVDWEHVSDVREAMGRADCDLLVNPDPIPEGLAFAVVDYEVEGGKGIEWLVYLLATQADRPVALLGPPTQRVMYAAWAGGAEVYLTVPFSVDELARFASTIFDRAANAEG